VWQAGRIDKLNEQAHAAKITAAQLGSECVPAADASAEGLHLHGPSALLRGFVAGVSLFILLMLALAVVTAPRGRGVAPAAAGTLEGTYRALLRIEWGWLAALVLLAQLMLALPIVLASWVDRHVQPLDFLTICAALLSLIIAPLAIATTASAYFGPGFAALARFRSARLLARRGPLAADQGAAGGLQHAFRSGLALVESLWEAWALPAIAVVFPIAAIVLMLLAIAFPAHASDRFFLVEQLIAPTARLSPFVPLWVILLGFVFLFGTRAIRISRALGTGPVSRLSLFAPWRQPRPHYAALREASRAIEAVENQSAVIDYWLGKVLRVAIVVILAVSFLFPRYRLTTQPLLIEWSLRLGLLGLALAATCLIGSGLEILRSLDRFWRCFSGADWQNAWDGIAPPLRAALRSRLFASLPEGYQLLDAAAGAVEVRESAAAVLHDVQPYQASLSSSQRQALAEIGRLASDQADQSPVQIGLALLARLGTVDGPSFVGGAFVRSAQAGVRRLLAPYVAELSLYLLSQLCRRLIAAIILSLILMLALESYPFQPHRFLVMLQLCFVGAAVGAAVWAYLTVNKSATLSAIVGDHAGLTFDLRLLYESLLFLGIPVLTVLSLHFPDFADFFGSAADAVKGIKI
jgi:hypothetical protein